ncbi:tripartite tricarboxylate transporter substrate-binding protein [Cupriavidus alkaliphilus]|uniref:tripartite tricarboxylate transporter substrate-binding protein n=1 Tax=Cupriavidus alkaliphilus TaxID=942866 RepID=UPI003CC83984
MCAVCACGIGRHGRSTLAAWPRVPTVAEAGLPAYHVDSWRGLLAPRGLPVPILARLNSELNAVLATPEASELLARDGAKVRPGSPRTSRRPSIPRYRAGDDWCRKHTSPPVDPRNPPRGQHLWKSAASAHSLPCKLLQVASPAV